ncbi:MAG: transposase [Ardenticatenia bacterium]|nr:transposase [Ardenticatenia bacterium]
MVVWCRRRGWHFALRLKGNRPWSWTMAIATGSRRSLWGPMGLRLLEGVRLVGAKRHGLGAVNIAITRSPQEEREPWFIVSDRSDTLGTLADYRCRMNIEHGFKDDKSGALGWEECRMDTVEQVDRHLLVMAVAVLYPFRRAPWSSAPAISLPSIHITSEA